MRSILVRLALIFGILTMFAALPTSAQEAGVANAGDTHWDGHFGTPGIYDGQIEAMAMANNNLYVGGSFAALPGLPDAIGIARWDGVRWHALGSGVRPTTARVRALAAAGANLYAAGDFTSVGGVSAKQIAHWDGTTWARLGSGVGPRRQYYGWEDETINAVATAPNGDVYVGGYFNYIDDVPARSIARWDGTRWHAVDGGIYDLSDFAGAEPSDAYVYGLAFAPDGTLYVGGQFSRADTNAVRNIARWNGTAWSALGAGIGSAGFGTQVATLLFHGGKLYAGGDFDQAGTVAAQHIAVWNGTAWSALGSGMSEDARFEPVVRSLLGDGDGILAAGDFTSAGEREIRGVARWNGAAWSAVGAAGKQIASDYLEVRALARAPEGGFVAAGVIDTADAEMTVFGITRWTGERWASLGAGVAQYGNTPAEVRAIATTADGLVFIGGRANYAGGIPVNGTQEYVYHISRFSAIGSQARRFPRQLKQAVPAPWRCRTRYKEGIFLWDRRLGRRALVYAHGELFIGGHFQTVHDRTTPLGKAGSYTAVHNLVSYTFADGSWNLVGPDYHPGVTTNGFSGFGTDVHALAYVGGGLYMGGTFNRAGGVSVTNLARYDLPTNSWSAIGGLGGEELAVFALDVYGPDLFVGGTFTRVDTAQARFVARYNTVGKAWTTLGSGMRWYNDRYTSVSAVAVNADGVYLGGKFDLAGVAPSLGFARWAGPLNPNAPNDPGRGNGVGSFKVYLPALQR